MWIAIEWAGWKDDVNKYIGIFKTQEEASAMAERENLLFVDQLYDGDRDRWINDPDSPEVLVLPAEKVFKLDKAYAIAAGVAALGLAVWQDGDYYLDGDTIFSKSNPRDFASVPRELVPVEVSS